MRRHANGQRRWFISRSELTPDHRQVAVRVADVLGDHLVGIEDAPGKYVGLGVAQAPVLDLRGSQAQSIVSHGHEELLLLGLAAADVVVVAAVGHFPRWVGLDPILSEAYALARHPQVVAAYLQREDIQILLRLAEEAKVGHVLPVDGGSQIHARPTELVVLRGDRVLAVDGSNGPDMGLVPGTGQRGQEARPVDLHPVVPGAWLQRWKGQPLDARGPGRGGPGLAQGFPAAVGLGEPVPPALIDPRRVVFRAHLVVAVDVVQQSGSVAQVLRVGGTHLALAGQALPTDGYVVPDEHAGHEHQPVSLSELAHASKGSPVVVGHARGQTQPLGLAEVVHGHPGAGADVLQVLIEAQAHVAGRPVLGSPGERVLGGGVVGVHVGVAAKQEHRPAIEGEVVVAEAQDGARAHDLRRIDHEARRHLIDGAAIERQHGGDAVQIPGGGHRRKVSGDLRRRARCDGDLAAGGERLRFAPFWNQLKLDLDRLIGRPSVVHLHGGRHRLARSIEPMIADQVAKEYLAGQELGDRRQGLRCRAIGAIEEIAAIDTETDPA